MHQTDQFYFETGAHDSYRKPPVYFFEMHRQLFVNRWKREFLSDCAAFYANVRERLRKDEENRFGYHFGDKDFFIYSLAHAHKHYAGEGTGLRTLLDVYLYLRAKPGMDEAYIEGELQKLGLTEFSAICLPLAEKLFASVNCPELTSEERNMLEWIENSGVYGTSAHRVEANLSRLQGGGGSVSIQIRAKYLLRRIFPEWHWYKSNAPFVYRHRWAAPFFWVFRGAFVNRRRIIHEVGVVCKSREILPVCDERK